MARVFVGRVGRPHGVQGELTLDSGLNASELLEVEEFTWRGPSGTIVELRLTGARDVHQRVLVRFAGYDDRDAAARLTNGELTADSELLPDAGPGVAYHFELVGLVVHTEDGRPLGTVADILVTAAHPIYVVRGEREIMIPAVPEVIRKVDLESRTMTVALPAGLEDIS